MLLQADPDAPPGTRPPLLLLRLLHQPAHMRNLTHIASPRDMPAQSTRPMLPGPSLPMMLSLATGVSPCATCKRLRGCGRGGWSMEAAMQSRVDAAHFVLSLCRLGTSMTSTAYCCALTATMSSPTRVLDDLAEEYAGLAHDDPVVCQLLGVPPPVHPLPPCAHAHRSEGFPQPTIR